MTDEDECGALGGMGSRGNQNTWRKPVPVPLVHHISHVNQPWLEHRPQQWESYPSLKEVHC
jgi:hypothetical protein